MGQQGDGEEDEVDLVGLHVIYNPDTGLGFEDIETGDKEQGGPKVYSQGNGDIAEDIGPSTDPGGGATAPGGR